MQAEEQLDNSGLYQLKNMKEKKGKEKRRGGRETVTEMERRHTMFIDGKRKIPMSRKYQFSQISVPPN